MPHGIRTAGNGNGSDQVAATTTVVDFNQARTQRMDEKRRKTERIFFKHLLGVYCVTEGTTGHPEMRQLEIADISEDGCAFQVPFDSKNPWPNQLKEMTLRLYFSQDTYIPINVKIQNSRPSIENGKKYHRYGCAVDTSLKSYEAYQKFVSFLKSYSEHAHKDTGDVTLFYL